MFLNRLRALIGLSADATEREVLDWVVEAKCQISEHREKVERYVKASESREACLQAELDEVHKQLDAMKVERRELVATVAAQNATIEDELSA